MVLQEAYAELAQLEASFRSRADSSQAALEKLVESKERREQELYIKVATLSFWLSLLTHIVISGTGAAVTLFTGSLPTLRCKLRN